MEHIVFNPQKGRLETIAVDFTDENTTWFENCRKPGDIALITDYNNGELLFKEYGWNYLVRIYDISRASIGDKQKQARKMLRQALME
ncbi:MAG: hypothetical protein ACD_74C00063G0002 [uncultured bacterium]|nr:MAG: hypothetical protein ACD_74C00063G0002 [uncultured bacterium]